MSWHLSRNLEGKVLLQSAFIDVVVSPGHTYNQQTRERGMGAPVCLVCVVCIGWPRYSSSVQIVHISDNSIQKTHQCFCRVLGRTTENLALIKASATEEHLPNTSHPKTIKTQT